MNKIDLMNRFAVHQIILHILYYPAYPVKNYQWTEMAIHVEIQRASRFSKKMDVYVNQEEWKQIDSTIFTKQPGLKEVYTSWEELNTHFDQLEYAGTKQFLFKSLSMKSQCSQELRKKLKKFLVSEKNSDKLLTEFKEKEYLNDNEWIDQFVNSQKKRGLGPRAIAQKLYAKGVSNPPILMTSDEEQKSQITALLSSRYRKLDLTNPKEKNKVIRSLLNKGFSLDSILCVLKE